MLEKKHKSLIDSAVVERLIESGIIKSMCQNENCNEDPRTCKCSDRDWEIDWSKIKETTPRLMSVCYDKKSGKETSLDNRFIYLGEIVNMPGHGMFMNFYTKQIQQCRHIDDFEEVPEDEV